MERSNRSSLKRSPTVVIYWEDDELVIENFVTRDRQVVDPEVIALLAQFGRRRSARQLLRSLSGRKLARARRTIEALKTGSFLHGQAAADDAVKTAWGEWCQVAGFFHFATKNSRFAQTGKAKDDVEQDLRDRQSNRPAAFKRYPGLPAVALPRPSIQGEFPRVLLERRTWRRFGLAPIDLRSLSTLLALSFGVHWKVTLDVVGTVALTTSPSGGARHPLEIYLVSQNVSGLAAGLYHYQSDTHRLKRIGRRLTREQVAACFPGQRWCARAPVIVFMTAVFGRTLWKYPDPHAYRVILAEAGHVCQTFCLAATWLGLAPFCTMALADSVIEKALRIDGISESVLYAAAAGNRPKGITWAPSHDTKELPSTRPTKILPHRPFALT